MHRETQASKSPSQIADDGHEDFPSVRRTPVFPEVNPLPSPQLQRTARNRDGKRGCRQHAADVRGHVVRAFRVVLVIGASVRRDALHESLEVSPYGRVRVLCDQERSARVLREDIAQADTNAGLRDNGSHTIRQRLEPSPTRLNEKCVLERHDRSVAKTHDLGLGELRDEDDEHRVVLVLT